MFKTTTMKSILIIIMLLGMTLMTSCFVGPPGNGPKHNHGHSQKLSPGHGGHPVTVENPGHNHGHKK